MKRRTRVFRPEFIESVKRAQKGKFRKVGSVEELLRGSDKSVVKLSELKRKLPEKADRKKLGAELKRLEKNNRIVLSQKGVTRVRNTNRNLRKAIKSGLEL